jgi:type I restriction enzyme S subunit
MIRHKCQTILGDIPIDWDAFPLRSLLADELSGDWGEDEGEVTLSVLRSTNFTDSGNLKLDDVAKRGFTRTRAEKVQVQPNDILVERSGGGPNQPVGRVVMIREEMPETGFANFVQTLRPDSTKIRPELLLWTLYQLNRSGFVEKLQHQTTQMRNLDLRDYLKILIPVPRDPEEQDRVAEALKVADEHILALEEQLRWAEKVKTALLREFFIAEPRRRNEPEECRPWKTEPVRVNQCGVIATGGTPERSNPSYYGGSILWVKSGEVNFNYIDSTEEHITPEAANSINGNLYPVGTVLIAMYGAGVTRGRSAILAKPAYVNQAIASIVCNSCTANRWLFYWFQRNYHRVRGFAGGANQDNLNLFLLERMKLSRPTLQKQEEIADTLTASDSLIQALIGQLAAARRVKRSLLQNLLTGKIRLKA